MTSFAAMSFGLLPALMEQNGLQAAEPMRLKVMTFNIWYGGEQVNFQSVISAIKAADPDIVGLQEPDGNTLRIAEKAGYPYVDLRRHLISKYPLFDSGVGERTEETNPPYSIAGVGDNAVHAWALVGPGLAVAVANTHLSSDPYGPELVRDGKTAEEVLANETELRMPEAKALVDGLKPVVTRGVPTFLTADFNAPSWRDWTQAVAKQRPAVRFPIEWPVSKLVESAGFADSFRTAHPDATKVPGLTWTPGYPYPYVKPTETLDRIDYVYAANAKVIDSVLVGESGNPDVTISVTPWPSDHRAVLSTFDVEPVKAPALIAVEPSLVVMDQPFIIRVNSPDQAVWSAVIVPRGGNPEKDALTGIAGITASDRQTVKLSTVGMSPGRYDAVMLDEAGKELTRTRFSVAPVGAKATLTIAASEVGESDPVIADFAGTSGYRFDWVGIYKRNEPSVYNYLAFIYTGARREGRMTITSADLSEPLAPGEYELRLMLDDHYETLAVAPFRVVKK
ncbi:endonuclease/exonuclease/phosphatase family protein [Rhizobium sp.]